MNSGTCLDDHTSATRDHVQPLCPPVYQPQISYTCVVNESSTGVKWVPDCPGNFKPFVGLRFRCLRDAIRHYYAYALACGFTARKGGESKSLKDGVILTKYLYCNKQGFKNSCATVKGKCNVNVSDSAKKRRRVTTRVGCCAMVAFQFVGETKGYQISRFDDCHLYPLSSPGGMQFLRASRDINIAHKKFIVDCAKVNIGLVKSYRLYKELVGGHTHVGATAIDFKNFNRDLKAYIGGSDAQMVIDNFFKRQHGFSGFYFDYDVDSTDTLTSIFWADPTARRNFALFGDMVSFDATYETNRYNMVFAPFTGVDHHKKCINFGAGFLAKENVESYTWLFRTFLKCMGHQPICLITDQDPAMKIAIDKVFDKTKHRFCMWHITQKLRSKVGPHLCDNTDFVKKFSSVIWSDYIELEEFEKRWKLVIEEFGLQSNDWLIDLFNLKKFWIPCYFRDLMMGSLMRTTSMSESENHFFWNFTNPFVTLVEFMMRFETALDTQRHMQYNLECQSKRSIPVLKTPLAVEAYLSQFYTHTVFYDVQAEICAACYSCCADSVVNEEGFAIYVVKEGQQKGFTVVHNTSDNEATCTCNLFERHGILCRHIFYVFRGMETVPNHYVLNRWTKGATKKPMFSIDGKIIEQSEILEDRRLVLNDLWSDLHYCVSSAEQKENGLKDFSQYIKDYKAKLDCVDVDECRASKSDVIESLIGYAAPDVVRVQPPRVSKNKGSGKRILSEKEKASLLANKPLRLCRTCGIRCHHDSRTCPLKEKAEAEHESAETDAEAESEAEHESEDGDEDLSD